MNTTLIANYLQFLRKDHHYTQDDLAAKLDISRQAVSKWETGASLPDLDVLLALSKLYDMTINDLLEPKIQSETITDFEQLSVVPDIELQDALKEFDTNTLVIASMGASPEINALLEQRFPHIDFESERNRIGRIRIDAVSDAQTQIIAMINLYSLSKEMPPLT